MSPGGRERVPVDNLHGNLFRVATDARRAVVSPGSAPPGVFHFTTSSL
jgi:hypothetical protein